MRVMAGHGRKKDRQGKKLLSRWLVGGEVDVLVGLATAHWPRAWASGRQRRTRRRHLRACIANEIARVASPDTQRL